MSLTFLIISTSFILQFVTSRSDISATCVTSSGPAAGQQCVFPFKYQGITHNTCADWIYGGEPSGTRWCSTKTDREGNHVNGQGFYGFCQETCANSCRTQTNKTCIFPFIYKNKTYTRCTDVDSVNEAAWCATKVHSNGVVVNNRWEDCQSNCQKDVPKEACPPLVGTQSPPGCSKTFIEDDYGDIPCQDDQDCPENKDWWIDEGCNTNGNGTIVNYGKCDFNVCSYVTESYCQVMNGRWKLLPYYRPPQGECTTLGWECGLAANLQNVPECRQEQIVKFDYDYDYTPSYEDGWFCESTAQLQDVPDCTIKESCNTAFCAGCYRPDYVSPTASVRARSSCQNCQKLQQCPPNKPCKLDGGCSRPYCTRRGRCWCPRY